MGKRRATERPPTMVVQKGAGVFERASDGVSEPHAGSRVVAIESLPSLSYEDVRLEPDTEDTKGPLATVDDVSENATAVVAPVSRWDSRWDGRRGELRRQARAKLSDQRASLPAEDVRLLELAELVEDAVAARAQLARRLVLEPPGDDETARAAALAGRRRARAMLAQILRSLGLHDERSRDPLGYARMTYTEAVVWRGLWCRATGTVPDIAMARAVAAQVVRLYPALAKGMNEETRITKILRAIEAATSGKRIPAKQLAAGWEGMEQDTHESRWSVDFSEYKAKRRKRFT